MVAITSATICGASPSDGSSISSTRGLPISARPIASICCSPPDRCAAIWLRRSCSRGNMREHRFRRSTAHAGCRCRGLRAATAGSRAPVRLLKMRRPCGTSATPRAAIISGGSRVDRRRRTPRPRRGAAAAGPTVTFMQVDLPAPLRPSRPSSAPSPSSNDTLLQHMAVAVEGVDVVQRERASGQDRPPGCADRPPLRRGCPRRSPRRNAAA